MKHLRTCSLVALLVLGTSSARAEGARMYNLEGFGSWLDGNPESTAVTEDGEVTLASVVRERYADAAAAFGAATALGDEVVVARNDDGRVLAIDRAGKERELFKLKSGLVTALASDGKSLYVAGGPPATIFRVDSRGRYSEFHKPDAGFIWDLEVGPNGTLYAVTGEPGQLLAIRSQGKAAEVLFEPDQDHLRTVTYHDRLGVFVGGGERGILYRASLGKPKAFRALFDTGHPEVTAVAVAGNHAYVAGVTGAGELAAEEGNEQQSGKSSKGPEVRSQLARVAVDGTAEVIAGSNDEAIFDVAVDDRGNVVVATGATGRDDPRGRLYTVEPARRLIAMVYQSPSRRITHLVGLPRGALAAVASGGGRITHLAGGVAKKGEFFTQPFDAQINSRFGIMQIFADTPRGTRVTGAVRTGQTSVPDESWSEWSREVRAPGNVAPRAENGRYMQLRLTLHGDTKQTPRVNRVRVAYQRQNLRPFVREVVALKKGLALLPVFQDPPKSKNVNLQDKANETQRNGAKKRGPNARARQVESRGALTVKWVAEDPNGDDLRYDLMVRGLGQRDWRKLESDLEQPFYTLQASQLPDGHYQFRVLASDAPSNPEGQAQSDTRESQAVLIDNTPPRVDPLDVSVSGRRVSVRAVVADAVGSLILAEYSLDGGDFRMLAPDDGVLDGPGESFSINLGTLEPGTHSIILRVGDEGENVGTGESIFVVK